MYLKIQSNKINVILASEGSVQHVERQIQMTNFFACNILLFGNGEEKYHDLVVCEYIFSGLEKNPDKNNYVNIFSTYVMERKGFINLNFTFMYIYIQRERDIIKKKK